MSAPVTIVAPGTAIVAQPVQTPLPQTADGWTGLFGYGKLFRRPRQNRFFYELSGAVMAGAPIERRYFHTEQEAIDALNRRRTELNLWRTWWRREGAADVPQRQQQHIVVVNRNFVDARFHMLFDGDDAHGLRLATTLVWSPKLVNGHYYATASVRKGTATSYAQRAVARAHDHEWKHVHHINGNTLDNRIANLTNHVATPAAVMRERLAPSEVKARDARTGAVVKGVYCMNGNWVATWRGASVDPDDDSGSGRKTKSFAINKYGEAAAMQMAIDAALRARELFVPRKRRASSAGLPLTRDESDALDS